MIGKVGIEFYSVEKRVEEKLRKRVSE